MSEQSEEQPEEQPSVVSADREEKVLKPFPSDEDTLRRQSVWAWLIAVGAVFSTLIPYLIGASMANGRQFMWLGYNLDDSCQYLSWMRQSAEGAFQALNMFTTDPQHGMALNPLFLVLGRIAGWLHLPLIAVYHGSRLLFGLVLLRLVWRLLAATVADARARLTGFLFVCFGSGLGWLPFWWSDPPLQTPIDKWQPEAITYLSLYLSPLFCFSMALQVGILLLLLTGVRTGRIGYAVGAGVCAMILGFVHTYDIVSLTAVWLVFLALHTLMKLPAERGQKPGTGWLQAAVAGAITLPPILYIYHELATEAVFRARAVVKTLSPSLFWMLAGYGLLLLFALCAAFVIWKRREPASASASTGETNTEITPWTTGRDASLLLVGWAIVNFAVAYIPTAIQRKLLQGDHFPMAILAGIGVTWLLWRIAPRLAGWKFGFAVTLLTLLLGITNLLFVQRDIDNYANDLAQTRLQRTYLKPGEIEALEWVREHSTPTDAVQPLPWIAYFDGKIATAEESVACFTPGLINRRVYCGHWGETPDFQGKLKELRELELGHTTDEQRREILRKMHVRYLIFSQKAPDDQIDAILPLFRGRLPMPDYLQAVHSNNDADVYEVSPNL